MSTGREVRSALTERKRGEPVGQKDASWIDGGDEKKKGRTQDREVAASRSRRA
jgi:hypothetical protein